MLSDYKLEGEWKKAANCDFNFCSKGGKRYFIKNLKSPKYPARKSDFLPETYKRLVSGCMEFEGNRKKINGDINSASRVSSAIVPITDFFREWDSYYVVSDAVNCSTLVDNDELYKLGEKIVLDVMLQMAEALEALANRKVVHGDLKPTNVFLSRTGTKVSVKIIDFDDSYYSGQPPAPEITVGSPEYYSPELAEYIAYEDPDKKDIVTCKNDIFAAGVMFHVYLTGAQVSNTVGKYPFQIDRSDDLQVSPKLKGDLRKLITAMLRMESKDRPDASQVAAAIRNIIAGKPIGFGDGGKKTGTEGLPKGPAIVPQTDGKYLYISDDGSCRILDEKTARLVAKSKHLPFPGEGDSGTSSNGTGRASGGRGDTSGEKKPEKSEEPGIIKRENGMVTFRKKDGSVSVTDEKTYEMLKRLGKV